MLARSLEGTRGRRWTAAGVLVLALAGAVSCGKLNTTGDGPSYLVIDSLQAAPGGTTGTFSSMLQSDVMTDATVYDDLGKVTLRMSLKDLTLTSPTSTNAITVTRYHVEYRRSDGKNTPGVDVPYGFDAAVTGTFGDNGSALIFTLVRAQAKLEAPLRALRNSATVISTTADVTFYGKDQNGNDVSVMGSISVSFADWGGPSANGAPVASFTVSPQAPAVYQQVFFNGTLSTAAAGRTIVQYDWDFGQGSQASGMIVSTSYNLPGTYAVVLTVTDDNGRTGSVAGSVTVK